MLLLLLAGASYAQFDDIDMRTEQCRQECCIGAGGEWDSLQGACMLEGGANGYYSCSNECLDAAGREIGMMGTGKSLCCAPALVIAALAAFSKSGPRGPPARK